MVPGLRTRSREQIKHVTERYTRKLYGSVSARMSKYAPKPLKWIASSAKGVAKGGARLASATLKTVGKVFAVADFGFIGFQTHSDLQRYGSGEIGGGVLAVKSVLRGGEVYIAILLLSPDPGTKVIVAAIAIGLLLAGADTSLDAFSDAKRERTRKLLEKIDHDARFHTAKRQLLLELKDL